jgi:hypothetical protein
VSRTSSGPLTAIPNARLRTSSDATEPTVPPARQASARPRAAEKAAAVVSITGDLFKSFGGKP